MSGRKQFDVDEALDKSMRAFWEFGYADTSLDVLTKATGLGRGSLYGTFGGKNDLFVRALERYEQTYGARYDAAMAPYAHDPVKAIRAFFDVVLDRIEDKDVPDGCLVAMAAAQSATLVPGTRERVAASLDSQRTRLSSALRSGGAPTKLARELASFAVAVNQSLGLLSRSGSGSRELKTIVTTTCRAVEQALSART